MSCGVGCSHGSDLALLWLWLWCGLAAVTLIGPLAWEPPDASGAALKSQKKKKNLSEYFLITRATSMATVSFSPHLEFARIQF